MIMILNKSCCCIGIRYFCKKCLIPKSALIQHFYLLIPFEYLVPDSPTLYFSEEKTYNNKALTKYCLSLYFIPFIP